MAALSAVVFTLSGWLGLYLLARDPRKPVLALAAIGLCSFALVVALDAVRTANPAYAQLLSQVEIYLVAVPSVAWFAVLVELARPSETSGAYRASCCWSPVSVRSRWSARRWPAASTGRCGPGIGDVRGDLGVHAGRDARRAAAAVAAGAGRPGWCRIMVVATLFFALGNAILMIPLGLVPSWLALASTGFDVLLLGVAVALWDAFDEGQALRADMLRSFTGARRWRCCSAARC